MTALIDDLNERIDSAKDAFRGVNGRIEKMFEKHNIDNILSLSKINNDVTIISVINYVSLVFNIVGNVESGAKKSVIPDIFIRNMIGGISNFQKIVTNINTELDSIEKNGGIVGVENDSIIVSKIIQ